MSERWSADRPTTVMDMSRSSHPGTAGRRTLRSTSLRHAGRGGNPFIPCRSRRCRSRGSDSPPATTPAASTSASTRSTSRWSAAPPSTRRSGTPAAGSTTPPCSSGWPRWPARCAASACCPAPRSACCSTTRSTSCSRCWPPPGSARSSWRWTRTTRPPCSPPTGPPWWSPRDGSTSPSTRPAAVPPAGTRGRGRDPRPRLGPGAAGRPHRPGPVRAACRPADPAYVGADEVAVIDVPGHDSLLGRAVSALADRVPVDLTGARP